MGEDANVAPFIDQVRVVISPSVSFIVAARPLIEALQNPGSVFDILFPGQTMVGGAASALTLRIVDFLFLFNKPRSEYCELAANEFKEESGIMIFWVLNVTAKGKLLAAWLVMFMEPLSALYDVGPANVVAQKK